LTASPRLTTDISSNGIWQESSPYSSTWQNSKIKHRPSGYLSLVSLLKKGMKGKEKHTILGAKINVLHVSNAVKFKSFLTIFILSV
jgi:hypothetical protein